MLFSHTRNYLLPVHSARTHRSSIWKTFAIAFQRTEKKAFLKWLFICWRFAAYIYDSLERIPIVQYNTGCTKLQSLAAWQPASVVSTTCATFTQRKSWCFAEIRRWIGRSFQSVYFSTFSYVKFVYKMQMFVKWNDCFFALPLKQKERSVSNLLDENKHETEMTKRRKTCRTTARHFLCCKWFYCQIVYKLNWCHLQCNDFSICTHRTLCTYNLSAVVACCTEMAAVGGLVHKKTETNHNEQCVRA